MSKYGVKIQVSPGREMEITPRDGTLLLGVIAAVFYIWSDKSFKFKTLVSFVLVEGITGYKMRKHMHSVPDHVKAASEIVQKKGWGLNGLQPPSYLMEVDVEKLLANPGLFEEIIEASDNPQVVMRDFLQEKGLIKSEV